MKVSFLIPAYNESRTIGEVLDRISALDLESQAIVVDDGSIDGTAEIAEEKGAFVIRQANRGKGAAIRAAIPAWSPPRVPRVRSCRSAFGCWRCSASASRSGGSPRFSIVS